MHHFIIYTVYQLKSEIDTIVKGVKEAYSLFLLLKAWFSQQLKYHGNL